MRYSWLVRLSPLKVKSALFAACIIGACSTGASFAVGEHALGRSIDTQAMFIRHTATKLQRQVAEQNAKAYVARLAPEKKLALKKKKIQYLAVPTVRSKETSPQAKEVLMIWDVPRETLVGKNVYELSTTPEVGKLASYDNLVAEYVGQPAKEF
jgi:deoxyribodipyrimidine photolyase